MSVLSEIGIVILAAGASTRLGSPKQLLDYNNKILLQHTIDKAEASSAAHITLVLGANADHILPHLSLGRSHIVINENWKQGMSSSIRIGLETLLAGSPTVGAVIFTLCDQPYLSSQIIDAIIAKHQLSPRLIYNCNYGEGYGPPTLFSSDLFPMLLNLRGSEGAKSIVSQYAEEVDFIDFPEGAYDIDTITDYENLINKH